MKKGKNMINQKNDLNMITRKLETELLTFHFDGLEISEITTTTSWMKLHINVVFIKDDVQITKVLYKDYETGLWYYIKDNGMIISHKDTFNHTIKNLIEEIPNVKKCSIAYCCQADRKHNRCGGTQTCRTTWKRYKAIINPEWHHVSLATLANIDFDMLDKKRQVYLKAHRELKRTLVDLSKCKTGHTYEARARKFMRDMISKYYDNEISYAMRKYLDLQLSMSNVVNGVWSSYVEPAMGLHESRRYSRPTLTY